MMQTLVQRHTQLVNKVQVRVERSRKAMQLYHKEIVKEHQGVLLDMGEVLGVSDSKVIRIVEHEDVQQSQEDTP
jgi:hypothetical protein